MEFVTRVGPGDGEPSVHAGRKRALVPDGTEVTLKQNLAKPKLGEIAFADDSKPASVAVPVEVQRGDLDVVPSRAVKSSHNSSRTKVRNSGHRSENSSGFKGSKEEEKRMLKRAANRKSAYTSRARKKQYVEEMTVANRDLKHHMHILDLLPDLIIGVDRHGEISFVSRSVSRKLQYDTNALKGASMYDIVTPETRHVVTTILQRQLLFRARRGGASSTSAGSGEDGSSVDGGSGRGSVRSGAGVGPLGVPLGSTPGSALAPVSGFPGVLPAAVSVVTCSSSAASSSVSAGGSVGGSSASTSSSSLSDERAAPGPRKASVAALSTSASSAAGSGSSNPEDADSSGSASSDELAGAEKGKIGRKPSVPSALYEVEGTEGDGRTFAKWSHVNLQRHNQEIDQQNEQAIWPLCLVCNDRTTIWCEANSNIHRSGPMPEGSGSVVGKGGVPVELIFSLRPVREGDPVAATFQTLNEKPIAARFARKEKPARTAQSLSSERSSKSSATKTTKSRSPKAPSSESSSRGAKEKPVPKRIRAPAVVDSDLTAAEALLAFMGK
mmetsp:Transcript_61283/g.138697  ORF Transcript_61283/g.138697 Transcript_61283/m.138697 type:complete len:554 (+) Transcript_61283:153-1814(+)